MLSRRLTRLSRSRNLDANAHRRYLECASRLKGHDPYLTEALKQLIRRQKLNVENRLLMLQLAADGIEADAQMSSFLDSAADDSFGNDQLIAAYLKCAATIESSPILAQRLEKDLKRRDLSATAIQAMIRALVDEEPPAKPLSDAKIAAILNDKGIDVARRTVAKYREALNIPSSSQRKRLV